MTWLVHTATLEPGCEVTFIYDRHGNFSLDCDIELDDMGAVTRRRFDIEFDVFRSIVAGRNTRFRNICIALTLAAAALAFWVTVGRAAPKPHPVANAAVFAAVLTPSEAREWMRSPLPSLQPAWLKEPSDAAH